MESYQVFYPHPFDQETHYSFERNNEHKYQRRHSTIRLSVVWCGVGVGVGVSVV